MSLEYERQEQQQSPLLLSQYHNLSGNDVEQMQNYASSEEVVARIELLSAKIISMLDEENLPILETYQSPLLLSDKQQTIKSITTKRFNMNQCRSFTSVVLVMSFCHALLQAKRTTTCREVYYFYVTHFRSQRECDLAIWDVATLLQVPRHSLGLKASPKGWFCGDIQLVRDDANDDHGIVTTTLLDGRSLQAIQGAPISSEWLSQTRNFYVQTASAKCILVVEKEGVYNRLSEDRFFDHYPCILVTGKGFPDLATRALVHHLHNQLQIPVRGLADCDPFGVMVLHTYQYGGTRLQRGVDGGDRYSVPMQWVGLRPSQVEQLSNPNIDRNDQPGDASSTTSLPDEVFQELTDLDKKRLDDHLLKGDHRWTHYGENERRVEELEDMRRYKVELEALNWLGMDFCAQWVSAIMHHHDDLSNNNNNQHASAPKEWLEII
jgi:meiotic recombination protein SPO11